MEALRSDVTPEGTLLIAFDGTGNHLEQNNVVAQTFRNVATTGGAPAERSFNEAARSRGARGKAAWAYKSHWRTDTSGRARAIYYNGPPEGVLDLSFPDSGAHFIFDDAFAAGEESPVCKAVRDPATKKVFFVGYSRGGILAHLAASRILDGVCGIGMGAKVTWVGLVDPVEAGSPKGYVEVEDCDAEAARHHVYDEAQSQGCLRLLRSRTTGQPVPVGVFLKTTEANVAADPFLLATMPVNGAVFRSFDFAGTAVSVHLDMGRSGLVYTALAADAEARGGLRFR